MRSLRQKKLTLGRLEKAADALDIIQKVLTCVAFVVGAVWAYFQFHISGAGNWMINLSMQTEVLPYKENMRLLVVHVKSKNPRPIKFELNRPNDSFTLVVREVPSDLKLGGAIRSDSGRVIGRTIDLLREEGEDITPNAEFDDVVGIVLPVCMMVSLTADMEIENGTKDKSGKLDHDAVSTASIVRAAIPGIDGDCLKH